MKEFNFKIGDIVYCYKNSYYDNIICHKEGNCYIIQEIYHDSFFDDLFITLSMHDDKDYNITYWFCYEIDKINAPLFYDYFISMTEYRKFKLKNIQNND